MWYFGNLLQGGAQQLAASGPQAYSLVADPASYSLGGVVATTAKQLNLNLASGSYSLTGSAATTQVARQVFAQTTNFALTGYDETGIAYRNLVLATTSYALTGVGNSLIYAKNLIAESSSYSLSGVGNSFSLVRSLVLGSDSFSIVGNVASTIAIRILKADPLGDPSVILNATFDTSVDPEIGAAWTLSNASRSTTTTIAGAGSLSLSSGAASAKTVSSSYGLTTATKTTLEFWIYFTAKSINYSYFLEAFGGGGNNLYLRGPGVWNGYWGGQIFGNGSMLQTANLPALNTWHHMALVRDGSNGYFFLNGNLVFSLANAVAGYNNEIIFGKTSPDGTYGSATCFIEEVRAQVGVAKYTANFTPPTPPLPSVGGFSLLGNQAVLSASRISVEEPGTAWITGFDATFVYEQGTISGDYTLTGVGNNFVVGRVLNAEPAGIAGDVYWNNVVILQHYSSNTTDEKGHSFTSSGGSFGVGKFGNALLNGGSGSIYSDHADYSNPGDFTIECWGKWNVTNRTPGQVLFNLGSGINSGMSVMTSGGTNVLKALAPTVGWLNSSFSIVNGSTYHIALTLQGSTLRLFVDGTLVGSLGSASSSGMGGSITIGNAYDYRNGVNYALDGAIDEFRFTKGVARYTSNFSAPVVEFLSASPIPSFILSGIAATLSKTSYVLNAEPSLTSTGDSYAANVVLLMECENALTNSAGTALAAGYGTTSFTTGTVGSYALQVDANSSVRSSTNTPYSITTEDLTIEFWWYNNNSTSAKVTLGNLTNVNAPDTSWYISCNQFWDTVYFSDGNSYSDCGYGPVDRVTVGWKHFAVTKQGTTVRVFRDGILRRTVSTYASLLSSSAHRLSIGKRASNDSNTQFLIDSIRITKGVARYTGNFTPNPLPFTYLSNNYIEGKYSVLEFTPQSTAGDYVVSGVEATLEYVSSIDPALPGSYTVTGSDVTFIKKTGYVLQADPATYAFSIQFTYVGFDATLVKTSAADYPLLPNPGSYNHTGSNATLTIAFNKNIDASPGSFYLTGFDIEDVLNYVLPASPSTYYITEAIAGFSLEVSLLQGTYEVTGSDSAYIYAQGAYAGNYDLIGDNSTLLLDKPLHAEITTYDITGFYSRIVLDVANLPSSTGFDSSLKYDIETGRFVKILSNKTVISL